MIQSETHQKNAHFRLLKPILILYILVGLVQSCATFIIPVLIGEFFTLNFNSDNTKGRLIQLFGINTKTLTSFFLLFTLFLIIRTIFEYFERWLSYQQGEKYVKYIREQLFAKQVSWNNEKFKEKHFGKYLLRYSNDMKALQNYLTKGIMGCIKDAIFLAIGFLLLSIIHQRLSFFLLIGTLILIVIILFISGFQKNIITISRNKRSGLLAFTAKSFEKHSSIKAKGTEERTNERFKKLSGELYTANMINNRFDSFLQSILPLFQYSIIGFLLWLITTSAIQINSNDALVFVLITLLMISPMKRVLRVPAILNKGRISLQKVKEILHSTNEPIVAADIRTPVL